MARIVVTGGAGFLGSHLCERILERGDEVVCVDNLLTGSTANLAHLEPRPGFSFLEQDVSTGLRVSGRVDAVLHFASPASPKDYLDYPIQTLKVGSYGTHNALGFCIATGARFLLASTSEVYGDPHVHPQPETYWGHVNPVGPRGVYDEAKRFAEALTMAYHRTHGVDTRIVRIFNTNEFTVAELAEVVCDVVGSDSPIVYEPLPVDDPTQRRPDISRARALLGWEPVVQLREGISHTVDHFRDGLRGRAPALSAVQR